MEAEPPFAEETVPTLVAVAELIISISLVCRGLIDQASSTAEDTILSNNYKSRFRTSQIGGNPPSIANS